MKIDINAVTATLAAGNFTPEDVVNMLKTRGALTPAEAGAIAHCAEVAGEPQRVPPMRVVRLTQGTADWLAYRESHWNASDAPAMMGESPYRTRAELVTEVATGVKKEVSAYTARIFNAGHRFEDEARAWVEHQIGAVLYTAVGTPRIGASKLSASFDGITMDREIVWEHKSVNAEIREAFDAAKGDPEKVVLPIVYRIQMEQQLAVSGAKIALFAASAWSKKGEMLEMLHCWYRPDMELRARIMVGWGMLERDVAAYTAKPPVQVVVAAAAQEPEAATAVAESMPALVIEAKGSVLSSNLDAFEARARGVLAAINTKPKTSSELAVAADAAKWCKDVEGNLQVAKESVIAQMDSVNAICKMLDGIADDTRKIRLVLEKAVKAGKEAAREAAIAAAQAVVKSHYDTLNSTLPAPVKLSLDEPSMRSAMLLAIKGLSSESSIAEKLEAVATRMRLEASTLSDRIHGNIAVLRGYKEHSEMFPDWGALAREYDKLELEKLLKERVEAALKKSSAGTEKPKVDQPKAQQGGCSLGRLCLAIAPLSISAAGLAALGFVGNEEGRYAERDIPQIMNAIANVAAQAAKRFANNRQAA